MTPADDKLLSALSMALGNGDPFATTVRVLGQTMSRDMARAMERQMLRTRSELRRAA